MAEIINPTRNLTEIDGLLNLRTEQFITDDFLNRQREKRLHSKAALKGENVHVASVPTAVVEKWRREGFDILTDPSITAKDIIARLKKENLDDFLSNECEF